ncbi:acyl carrier protein [Petroclostridium sp. X23]|uniref:acyl carrier protein n=1 Tax=Petroclostridium sp. X23 TaxID=3045146 RepID=UPI0024AD92E3|nr:acyl carrier protein [Petroclostridium sp. X23]WHH58340.1 acyl carrier protein [Petroclostridium sp. X23]
MTQQQVIEFLEEILEVEAGSIQAEQSLDDIDEWDSVAALSFAVGLDEFFGKPIKVSDIASCSTVKDLIGIALGDE